MWLGCGGRLLVFRVRVSYPVEAVRLFFLRGKIEDVLSGFCQLTGVPVVYCRNFLSGPLYPKLPTCFEGAQLTQLVQLVTAGRLFLGHKV